MPPEFAEAGVAGVMDLVASLEWARHNIEKFGGDTTKVMIFGQSGRGAKTSTLLVMPPAKGLLRCAGVQSGSSLRLTTREQGGKLADTLLEKLGISKSNIADIQQVSWQQILEAQNTLGLGLGGFAPVVEGKILPHHPFDPSARIRRRAGADLTTLQDAALALTNFDLDAAGLKAWLNQRFKTKADEIYVLYKASPWTEKKIAAPHSGSIFTDSGFRRSAMT